MSKSATNVTTTVSSASTTSSSSSSTSSNLINYNSKCTYCQNSLGSVSIKCSVCINFQLCLKCFSMSAELGEHKKDHNYYLKSNVCFPIFDSEHCWSYKEELLLLQFIEQYGFGNWDDIAKHLTNRTADECMQHYYSYYVYGNLGKYTLSSSNLKQLNPVEQSCDNLSKLSLILKQKSENCFQEESTKNETTVLLPPIEMSTEEQRALGYMPLRDDFEREYKHDAESLLSNLSIANNQLSYLFNNSKSPQSTELTEDQLDFDIKLTLIKIYRDCLFERQRLKKIAREYGLINNTSALINSHNKAAAVASGLSSGPVTEAQFGKSRKAKNLIINDKDMTELNDKFKKYAQFISVSDYETLLESLRKQRQLNDRLKELETYRSNGLTKLAEIENFNREHLEKQKHKLELRQFKKQTKRMLNLSSPNKRLTRLNSLKSPISSFSLLKQSPSKRLKTYEDKTLVDVLNEETCSNEDMMTDDLNESDDLYQEESDDDLVPDESLKDTEESQSEDDEKEIEEDLSSAGAASSGGSAVNEVNPNNIIRRLRRLTSRSAQNNSFTSSLSRKRPARLNTNLNGKNGKLNMSLNLNNVSSKAKLKLKSKVQSKRDFGLKLKNKIDMRKKLIKNKTIVKDESMIESESNVDVLNENEAEKTEESILKIKKLKKFKDSKNGRKPSERLCSMPGYNLLSENEKKTKSNQNSLAFRKHKSQSLSQSQSNSSSLNTSTSSHVSSSLSTYPALLNGSNSNLSKANLLKRNSSESEQANPNGFMSHSNHECKENNSQNSPNSSLANKNKLMINLLKMSCPTYFEISRSTRRRILRFLCDNGWIDVS